MMDASLHDTAAAALEALRAAGFEHAQAGAAATLVHELNATDNEPSLLRSVESRVLTLTGIVDGRLARSQLTTPEAATLRECAARLFDDARAAPHDDGHAVSSGQQLRLVQGPQACEPERLTAAMAELLAYRKQSTPTMHLESVIASHEQRRFHTLTSGGSDLAGEVACYSLLAMGTARDGARTSSFNYTAGSTNELGATPAHELFGLGAMMRDTVRQTDAKPLGEKFVGDVVLAPNAVEDLVGWLLEQLRDSALLAGTSLYREQVGQAIAAPSFTLTGQFDLPGVACVSADGFVTPPTPVVQAGVLQRLLPSLYASRKTGLPHAPTGGMGWVVEAGPTPLADLVGAVQQGALVGRLSMGRPAANGNFSGVIKNSFRLRGGEVAGSLSETMITGNVGAMLRDIVGASRERQDGQGWRFPWLRVRGLHFS
jgi:PmbA protein